MLAGVDPIGIVAGDDVAALIAASEVVIEFSTPEATLANAARAPSWAARMSSAPPGSTPSRSASYANTPSAWPSSGHPT